jgi:alpha 1,3-glucosidase
VSVKHENFKTCDQSGFCKRNRQLADDASASRSWTSPYVLDPASIAFKKGQLDAVVFKRVDASKQVRLPLTITFLDSGVARVTLDEELRAKGEIDLRHDSKARKERYNEAGNWALVGGLKPAEGAALSDAAGGYTKVVYGKGGNHQAIIRHSPFSIDFQRNGETQIKFNERGLMNLEHWRAKVEKPVVEKTEGDEENKKEEKAAEELGEDESTWWEETFGGNTDSKPRGPEAIALDISFPGYEHVFGIPEHATGLSLKTTRYAVSFEEEAAS